VQGRIDEKRAEEHRSEIAVKEIEVRLESFQLHLNKSEQSLAEWERRLEEFKKNLADTHRQIEHCKVQVAHIQRVRADATVKIQEHQKKKLEVSAQIEELLLSKTALEEKNKALDAALQTLRENQRQLSETAHQVELELRSYENDRKNAFLRVEEIYQITPEQAREQLGGQAPEPVDAEELQRLRKRVESMSNSVNLEAPEQFQGLQERHTYLTTQIADLTKAKEDLKATIAQINGSTKEQFRETFTKVRENFRTIYGTLFQGGNADLVFTDETNLLETGIDIVAQPPGKKPQSIQLLSGGEKTLTATALLFAFFMVKPSPFCVLDEVDAPLDPANVSRFLNLLKEFSHKTQFMVVTHNPRTMESADVLYGVTIEESGVSKVLSARLSREQSKSTVELTPA
jgi:chromosome segregation protein